MDSIKETAGREDPGMMRAIVYRRYGSPDRLSLERVAIPTPKPDEVLVRVQASTVNRTDCGFLRAKPWIVRFFSGIFRPRSTTLGCEFAGEIVALGPSVQSFSVGDRVVGFKDDDFGFGGHAEYTTMPESGMLARIADHCEILDAVPALEGAHYALQDIRKTGLVKGQSVLINGATGAIGSAAVQILKHIGVEVTAVCSAKHFDVVLALGADQVIDYETEDFTRSTRTYDCVFDAVGKSTFRRCRPLLTETGIYASTELGPWLQNPILALWTRNSKKQKVIFPLPINDKDDAVYLAAMMAEGTFRPLVDRVYNLENTADAFRYVEKGMKVGNVVIEITHQTK